MGAKMVNEVASKTRDVVGDGTTTATVLAEAIYLEGLKHVTAGANPMSLFSAASTRPPKSPASTSSRPASRSKATTISPRSPRSPPTTTPQIGKLLADAMDKVGKEGVIEVEEGKGMTTS